MSDAGRVCLRARGEVGYHEGRDPNGNWNNIQKYSEELPGFAWSDGQAYCDTGLDWCFWKEDLLGALIMPTGQNAESASVRTTYDAFNNAGRFTEYPVIGGPVIYGSNFSEHVALCVGFTDTTVDVVGFNSNNNGSAQGDGVYLLTQQRSNPNLRGYCVPLYPDGKIVSADPKWNNPDGNGTTTPDPVPPANDTIPASLSDWDGHSFPGSDKFGPGQNGPWITFMGQQLQRVGINPYAVGPSDDWGPKDQEGYAMWQRFCGYSGADADGIPGQDSWNRLVAALDNSTVPPPPPARPAPSPEAFPGRGVFTIGNVDEAITDLGEALARKGFGSHYTSGPGPRFTEADRANVQDFQNSQGWSGGDADGYPGPETWRRLMS